MRQGLSVNTDHTVGSRRAESLRARSGALAIEWARRGGVLRRRSAAEARPVAARVRHCPPLKGGRCDAVERSLRRLPVTQCRPWPAEDVWSEARAAPALCTGAGKRAQRFLAASSFRVIRGVLTSNGASVRLADVAKRIAYSPRSERSESMSGARFPARGSRPRPAKAGAASAAAEPFKSCVVGGRRSAFARAIFQASYGETRRSLGVGGPKPAAPLLTRQRRQRVPQSLLMLAAPSIQYLFHSPTDTFASVTSPQTAREQAIVGRVDVPDVRTDRKLDGISVEFLGGCRTADAA